MKTKEQIKTKIKKLESEQERIWKDDELLKLDRIDPIEQRIKALKWVLR